MLPPSMLPSLKLNDWLKEGPFFLRKPETCILDRFCLESKLFSKARSSIAAAPTARFRKHQRCGRAVHLQRGAGDVQRAFTNAARARAHSGRGKAQAFLCLVKTSDHASITSSVHLSPVCEPNILRYVRSSTMDPAQHIFVWIRAELCIGTSLSADPKFSDQCSPTSVYAPAPLCPRTTPTFWIPLLPPLHTHTPNSFSHPPHCHLPNALVLMLCWRSLEIFGHRGSSECANEQRGHAVRSPRGAASLQSARPGERLGCCKVQPGAGQFDAQWSRRGGAAAAPDAQGPGGNSGRLRS
jgi:hypothetical protein